MAISRNRSGVEFAFNQPSLRDRPGTFASFATRTVLLAILCSRRVGPPAIEFNAVETRDIDMRLQRYTAAEHRIGANLQELEQHSVYQLLMTDALTGATAKALRVVNDADPSLWELFTLLGTSLDSARQLRGTGSRVSTNHRLTLAERLSAPSILIRSHQIPLGERGLTGAPIREEYISIEALIDRMSSLYEPVRNVVTHAEKVLREILPRLNSAEATVTRLHKDALVLGLSTVEIDRIDETIARIRELSLTDPLSIPANARQSFDDAIHAASATVSEARASHDALAADITGASELLDTCRDLIEQANQHRTETFQKISQPVGLRQPPSLAAIDGERGLAMKLDPILASNRSWQSTRRELDSWSVGATRLRDQLARVVASNRAPLEKRNELRGRLGAFRAKMAATGFSEDLVLRDISAEAHNELFTSPTDLVRAERLVTEFGNRLAT